MADFADFGIELPPGRRGEVRTVCPKCTPLRKRAHQRERDLAVNTDDGIAYCHHCGWSISLKGGADTYGSRPPLPKPKREYVLPEPPPESALPPELVRWFAKRGIPEWVLEDMGVTAETRDGAKHPALAFPYRRDGQTVHVKYRSADKRFWSSKDTERILYGLDAIRDVKEFVIVEGEVDALSVMAVHGPPCVSVPDGAPSIEARDYASKFDFLSEPAAQAAIANAERVILATDADAPGRKLADELARRIGHAKCSRVTWPEGVKDANECLVTLGTTALCDALANTQPWPVAGIFTIGEIMPEIETLWRDGFDPGRDVDWPEFDRHFRARTGLLTLVGGVPSHGKSVFVDNLIVRLARRHGWRFAICSPEHVPLAHHAATLLTIDQGMPFWDGPNPRMPLERIRDVSPWLGEHVAFVLPEPPTVDEIIARADVLVYRHGITGLVIDPWTELDHTRPNGMTETEFVGQELSKLRRFARQREVCIFLIAHPAKWQKTKDGSIPVPSLHDMSGSANFSRMADAGFSVWRDPATPSMPTEVHIQKIRWAETGQPGIVKFRFDLPTRRFYEDGQRGPLPARPAADTAPAPLPLPSQQIAPWE